MWALRWVVGIACFVADGRFVIFQLIESSCACRILNFIARGIEGDL